MKLKIIKPDKTTIEAEGTVAELSQLFIGILFPSPPVSISSIFNSPIPSVGEYTYIACQHQYPEVWHGINPPSCLKCGLVASNLSPTYTYTTDTLSTGGTKNK